MEVNKKAIVTAWWQDCVRFRSQMNPLQLERYGDLTRPRTNAVKWKSRITNEVLYSCFIEWMRENCALFVPAFNKQGFCTLLYGVADATNSKMTVGGKRVGAVSFTNYTEHRQLVEKKRQNRDDAGQGVVERTTG